MKKSIIAAGAASVALAAMPVLGVFADTTTYVVDDISATVQQGCTVSRAGSLVTDGVEANFERLVSLTVVAGQTSAEVAGQTVTISCSDPGWNVNAKGTGGAGIGQTGTGTTLIDNAVSNKGVAIAAGTTGTTSWWSYRVAYTIGEADEVAGTAAGITGSDVNVIPTTANTTANGNKANTGTFTPYYQVHAQSDQKSGTYEGQVTYTVNMPAVVPGA